MSNILNPADFFACLRQKIGELGGQPALELAPEESFLATGLIDSIAVVDLIGFVEERFGIAVDPMDLSTENFGSMASIHQYVLAKHGEGV